MTAGTSGTTASMTIRELSQANLCRAASDFSVANSPLFLLRKLRDDPVVMEIGRRASANALLTALRRATKHRPKKIVNAVRPYAYLVAIAQKRDPKLLHDARQIAAPHHPWFEYLATVLLNGPTSTTILEVPPPQTVNVPDFRLNSSSLTKKIILSTEG